MPSWKDIFPEKWLKADMLLGKRARVTVERVYQQSLFNPTAKKYEDRLVAKFAGKELQLILNQTQCRALATIAQNDNYEHWRGLEVYLSVARASNGKNTIAISAASLNPTREPSPQPAARDDDDFAPDDDGEVDFGMGANSPDNPWDDSPAARPVHGQPDSSGARPGDSAARPDSEGQCPVCHAPAGKPHTKRCTASARPAEDAAARPAEDAAARPVHGQLDSSGARPVHGQMPDDDPATWISETVIRLYDSGRDMSKDLSEFLRKASNADSDSTSTMSGSYLHGLLSTLVQSVGASQDEARLMLAAMVGYPVDTAHPPGQLLHGYLIKPLRDHDSKVISILGELLNMVRAIEAEYPAGERVSS